jgi:tRNA threonylcarbamoyladenosine biosynthesis protein TsaE
MTMRLWSIAKNILSCSLMKLKYHTDNQAETESLAEKIGRKLKGGEVIELISDLGGGKTTFVRGLARGIGSKDHVASPTFTISRLYKSKKLELHHFDFYRLDDAGIMEYEIHDEIGNPQSAVVIEWGDVVRHVLPDIRLTIHITSTGDETREFKITYPVALAYLVEGLE